MRVFVTGATGFIGSAVVKDLLEAGHQVTGLARSEKSVQVLKAAGAQVHQGTLDDLESLKRGAAEADGVIHTAFIHDFANFEANCKIDSNAIEALGAALVGSDRPLIVTSGTALIHSNHLATEDIVPTASSNPRIASELAARSVAEQGVRVIVVRLPPTVHGEGDHAFIPLLIANAREKGTAAYVGEGLNRWPAVHRFDAARLFKLALEKSSAGTMYHGVAEEGVAFKEIAEVIGRRLKLPVVSKSVPEAAEHFGWFAAFAALDNPVSSKKTQALLGWQPTQPKLIADLDRDSYFSA